MAHSTKLSALVLSRRSAGEADRAVTFFTRELGLLRVLAKGVRKIPSRRGGHLEPFTQVAAVVTGTPGRWWLAAAETRDYFRPLHAHTDAMASARGLAWAAVSMLEYEAAYPAVFAALHRVWQQAPRLTSGPRALLEASALLLLLRAAGLQPRLSACASCGEQRPAEAVVLEAERGGWRCLSCLPAGRGVAGWREAAASLTPQGLNCLRLAAMSSTPAAELTVTAAQGQQLRAALYGYVRAAAGVRPLAGVS